MTLRNDILASIMYRVEVKEDELIRMFGEAARPEIQSLLELGVIKEFWKRTGVFYEVTKIKRGVWGRRKG
jgi:chromosome segregation and condensation protein ScpB